MVDAMEIETIPRCKASGRRAASWIRNCSAFLNEIAGAPPPEVTAQLLTAGQHPNRDELLTWWITRIFSERN